MEDRGYLNLVESDTLVDFLLQMSDRGFPATCNAIYEYALDLVQVCHPNVQELGANWVDRFITHNADRINMKWSPGGSSPMHGSHSNLHRTQKSPHGRPRRTSARLQGWRPLRSLASCSRKTGWYRTTPGVPRRHQDLDWRVKEAREETIVVMTNIDKACHMLSQYMQSVGNFRFRHPLRKLCIPHHRGSSRIPFSIRQLAMIFVYTPSKLQVIPS